MLTLLLSERRGTMQTCRCRHAGTHTHFQKKRIFHSLKKKLEYLAISTTATTWWPPYVMPFVYPFLLLNISVKEAPRVCRLSFCDI